MCFLLQHLKRLNAGTSSVEYVRKILILGQRGGKCLNVFTEIKKDLFYFLFLFHSYLPVPIGACVNFWNSPSKLGSVQ